MHAETLMWFVYIAARSEGGIGIMDWNVKVSIGNLITM